MLMRQATLTRFMIQDHLVFFDHRALLTDVVCGETFFYLLMFMKDGIAKRPISLACSYKAGMQLSFGSPPVLMDLSPH